MQQAIVTKLPMEIGDVRFPATPCESVQKGKKQTQNSVNLGMLLPV